MEIISLPACYNYNGLENAANLNYQYNVDLLIGAACDEETETVSRLALRWHKIYLSSAALSTKQKWVSKVDTWNSNSRRENTTIALKTRSSTGIAEMITTVCKAMKWEEIGLIYSENTEYSVKKIWGILSANTHPKVRVFLQTDGVLNANAILNSARALFSFLTLQDLVTFLRTLKNEAVRPLEYPIIHVDNIDPSRFFNHLNTTASTYGSGVSAARLRKLHRHVALIRNVHNSLERMRNFAAEHNLKINDTLYDALILCDGLKLLQGFGRLKNRTISQELPRIWHHITNTKIDGFAGPIFIGSNGVRLPYFEMFLWRDNLSIKVARISPRDPEFCNHSRRTCYEFSPTTHTNLLNDLPAYHTECGFDNSLCRNSNVLLISGFVLGLLVIPLGIASYFQRKEHLIQQMPWRVPLEKISFDEDAQKLFMTSSKKKESLIQSSGSRGVLSSRVSCLSIFGEAICEHAFVNRQKVAVKRIGQRQAITFSRKEMEFLNQLKHITHNNINSLCGICFNQSSEMMVMWNFVARHSLEDLIYIKERKFGRNFQSTFIKHILNGTNFIHNSAIRIHGALYLSNCLVDTHFVVKLTDFGIRRTIFEKIRDKELLSSLDVNSLHYKYLQQAPEHLSFLLETHEEPLGSVEGDIYQLAMLIYQILFYLRPFANRNEEILEIGKMIVRSPIHPIVPDGSMFTMRLLSVMQQCWLHKPNARPSLLKITDAVNREFWNDAKGPLIDQMIGMIDEYSSNLEKIVCERTRELEDEMAKTENLLYQLLPKQIADSIRSGNTVAPVQHSSVSVLVADVCQFTKLCEELIPIMILETLQDLYSSFDYIIQKNRAFKVENVGDVYLICSGIPEMPDCRHLREVCRIAILLQKFMSSFCIPKRPDRNLEIKIGINSGSVVSGVLGSLAPRYCLFGETVHMACRMASTSEPRMTQLSDLCANTLKSRFPAFLLDERGMVDVKGKGQCLTYWLKGEIRIDRDSLSNIVS